MSSVTASRSQCLASHERGRDEADLDAGERCAARQFMPLLHRRVPFYRTQNLSHAWLRT